MTKKELLSNARLPGEHFDKYRSRRQAINKEIKLYLQGRVIWRNGTGTYKKDVHGPLSSS